MIYSKMAAILMKTLHFGLLCLIPLSLGAPSYGSTVDVDVCIVGGGSAGTYSAIRLQQLGKTVALIEKQDRLGGHVNTYVDPATNQTYDYGVQIFSNISVVTNYFEHFNIPLKRLLPSGGGVDQVVNFETGKVVPPSELITGNLSAALIKYAEQEAKFPTIFDTFDLPYPVPEELLMPFGDFLTKYNLSAMAYIAFEYNQGVGNILAQPTLYMMKYLDPLEVSALLTSSFVYNGLGDNQLLYDRALAELGSSAFLNSSIEHITRNDDCVEVYFSTPSGRTVVKASKLLITIPPLPSNLGFLDLDSSDRSLLTQFNNSYYWDMMIKNTGIPDNTSVSNVNPDAPYNIPALPGLYGFEATPIENVHATYYSSPHFMSDEEVKADTLATLAKIRTGLGLPDSDENPEFVGFNNHSPFELEVSTQAIQDGFYKVLVALQGKQRTWWTGATWITQASSNIWNFTEYHVLPSLI